MMSLPFPVEGSGTLACAIGAVFMAGGIAASFMIPAPIWFIVLDLVAAYLPMVWLGLTVAERLRKGNT